MPGFEARREVGFMEALLRFLGAVERDPTIGAWFARQPNELGSIARSWFARMRVCGADRRELLQTQANDAAGMGALIAAAYADISARSETTSSAGRRRP